MIRAFYRTPEGELLLSLVKAFDFKILPNDFRNMTKNEINELLVIREMIMEEVILQNGRG